MMARPALFPGSEHSMQSALGRKQAHEKKNFPRIKIGEFLADMSKQCDKGWPKRWGGFHRRVSVTLF